MCTGSWQGPFLSPGAALLLVSTTYHDLCLLGRFNTRSKQNSCHSAQVQSLAVHAQKIGPSQRWQFLVLAKTRRLWGWEWVRTKEKWWVGNTGMNKAIRACRTGEPVDIVLDVCFCPWWVACNKSVNEVIRPVAKWTHSSSFYLNFLLITEQEVPFRTTCEMMKGWDRKLKDNGNCTIVTKL